MPQTHLAAFAGNERCEGFGVEAGEGETEAAVHAVGRQLQRLLSDVVLKKSTHSHILVFSLITGTCYNVLWSLVEALRGDENASINKNNEKD